MVSSDPKDSKNLVSRPRNCDRSNAETGEITIEGWKPEEVQYHIKLLLQAGLIDAIDASAMGDDYWIVRSLTWNGHEFLDASRNQTIWNKAKSLVTEKGGVLSFEVLKAALIKASLEAVSLLP